MDRQGLGLRRLIGLLLALNGGALAAGLLAAYWPGKPTLTLEFNADKVTRLASPAGDVPSPPKVPEVVQAETPAVGCLAWKSLDADGLEKVEAGLASLGLVAKDYDFQLDKPLGWWVYLPPFADGESLSRAMESVRAKGVVDFAPVRGGRMANALSLGAFPSLAKARLHAQFLTGKGISGVRFGPRPGENPIQLNLNKPVPVGFSASLVAKLPDDLKPAACPALPP